MSAPPSSRGPAPTPGDAAKVPRRYTEDSPVIVAIKAKLIEEWMVQKARHMGVPPVRPSGVANDTVFTKAAMMCVTRDINAARLVSAALKYGEHLSHVQPNLLVAAQTVAMLNATVGVDDEGNEHKLMSAHEANYRAEWNKVRALLRAGTPAAHLRDPSYSLRPLTLWVLATKRSLDTTTIFLDAAAEYRRNKVDADAVFGTDVFKGLR